MGREKGKESSLAVTVILQHEKDLCTHTVCLQSGKAQGTLCVRSYLSNSSAQVLLIFNVHILRGEPAGIFKDVQCMHW